VDANLKDQLVSIEGTGSARRPRPTSQHSVTDFAFFPAAPSEIVAAIQSTGRDAILRGSGGSNGKLQVSVSCASVLTAVE
jgi:copper chaperone for superoxide dismutase